VMTLEGSFVRVVALVDRLAAAGAEGLGAGAACVGPGIRMQDPVAAHIVLCVELGLTDVALEGFVASVALQVELKVQDRLALVYSAALVTEPGLGAWRRPFWPRPF